MFTVGWWRQFGHVTLQSLGRARLGRQYVVDVRCDSAQERTRRGKEATPIDICNEFDGSDDSVSSVMVLPTDLCKQLRLG